MVGRFQASAPRAISGLYALTPDSADTRTMAASVGAALDGGAAAIQYRNKAATPDLRLQQARVLRAVCADHGAAFIVNDDIDLARAVTADGVHLGRDDATIMDARARLHPGALIGASCYDSLDRAVAAVAAGADYIAFGSFYSSSTKPQAARAGLSLILAAKARWTVPVVAIGGITVANAPALIDAGADAVAVISALFDAPDVAAAARSFAALFDHRRCAHERLCRRP